MWAIEHEQGVWERADGPWGTPTTDVGERARYISEAHVAVALVDVREAVPGAYAVRAEYDTPTGDHDLREGLRRLLAALEKNAWSRPTGAAPRGERINYGPSLENEIAAARRIAYPQRRQINRGRVAGVAGGES